MQYADFAPDINLPLRSYKSANIFKTYDLYVITFIVELHDRQVYGSHIVGTFARRIYVHVLLCDRGATAFHDGQVSE